MEPATSENKLRDVRIGRVGQNLGGEPERVTEKCDSAAACSFIKMIKIGVR